MQRKLLKILTIALLATPAAYGQSLGDVARENREKKAEDASAPAQVITNKDLPKEPDGIPGPAEAAPASDAPTATSTADQRYAEHRSAQQRLAQRLAEQRAADRWKGQILSQKNKMAALQARIDQLNSSIRPAYGTAQYEGPSNFYQARQLQRVAQMQLQLNEENRKLDQMQEAARHAGMHTTVYDP